jgi:hypothetical protein
MDERLQFPPVLLERNGDNFVPTANLPDNRFGDWLEKTLLRYAKRIYAEQRMIMVGKMKQFCEATYEVHQSASSKLFSSALIPVGQANVWLPKVDQLRLFKGTSNEPEASRENVMVSWNDFIEIVNQQIQLADCYPKRYILQKAISNEQFELLKARTKLSNVHVCSCELDTESTKPRRSSLRGIPSRNQLMKNNPNGQTRGPHMVERSIAYRGKIGQGIQCCLRPLLMIIKSV